MFYRLFPQGRVPLSVRRVNQRESLLPAVFYRPLVRDRGPTVRGDDQRWFPTPRCVLSPFPVGPSTPLGPQS